MSVLNDAAETHRPHEQLTETLQNTRRSRRFRSLSRLLRLKDKSAAPKRDNWFTQYQEIPQLGIVGKRNAAERLELYRQEDFVGASVLDIGCNQGQMCFQSKDWGATRVLGVEYDQTAYSDAVKFNQQIGTDVNFILDDIDNPFFWNSIDPIDVSLFLSVIDTKELQNRFGILAKVCQKTKRVMYLEGHTGPYASVSRYFKHIIDYTDFTEVVYLGETKDREHQRSLFRCTREKLSSEQCVEKLQQSEYSRIAVVGRGCAGKTHIRKMLEERGGAKDYSIIDDLAINRGTPEQKKVSRAQLNQMERYILFDYRALEYVDNFDVVYFVSPCESRLNDKHDPSRPDLRCPAGSLANVKEMYTVVSKTA